MTTNDFLTWNLTRGDPNNDPVGMSADKVIFGKSIGGQLFDKENLLDLVKHYHNLYDGNEEIFDSIIPSDIIKQKTTYRALFIVNRSESSQILPSSLKVSNIIPDQRVNVPLRSIVLDDLGCVGRTRGNTGTVPLCDTVVTTGSSGTSGTPAVPSAICEISIAVENVYTLNECYRKIPADFGKPGNPSIVLVDEFDISGKLSTFTFKKELTASDLPIEIPPNCALKIWLKRVILIDKYEIPDDEIVESFTITMSESNGYVSELTSKYTKLKGRMSLSKWFSADIVLKTDSAIILKEVVEKNTDIKGILKTFSVDDNLVVFSYDACTTNHFLHTIKPNDSTDLNKYIQVQLLFQDLTLPTTHKVVSSRIIDIQKSFYDNKIFYIFWSEDIEVISGDNVDYFGQVDKYTRFSVDVIYVNTWVNKAFDYVANGFNNRKIESYKLIDFKVIRERHNVINVEHFDDLFIFFTKNEENIKPINIESEGVNSNQLVYLFEKDILSALNDHEKKIYPGVNSEVLSCRLYPASLPTVSQIVPKNKVRDDIRLLISDASKLTKNIASDRKIKLLLDGTRYIDNDSCHGRAFDIGKNSISYEFPSDIKTQSYSVTTGILVKNTDSIYSHSLNEYFTNHTIENCFNGHLYEKPLFQQNIIDDSRLVSKSIPIEWADRVYRDEWITIASTMPIEIDQNFVTPYTLQYNFYCNMWRTVSTDKSGDVQIKYNDHLTSHTTPTTSMPVTSVSNTGTSGIPFNCASYTDINVSDLAWVIEPDVFQPLTFNVSYIKVTPTSNSMSYLVNIKVFFKGNEIPLSEVNTYSNDIINLNFITVNPNKTLDLKVNYFDVCVDSNTTSNMYNILNVHRALLNKVTCDLSDEKETIPDLQQNQIDFSFYRTIDIAGLTIPSKSGNLCYETTIPIVLYGNSYKINSTDALTSKYFGVKVPFDFKKVKINDKTISVYSDMSSSSPLNFEVAFYDYDKDYAVIWVKLSGIMSDKHKLYLFYGKNIKNPTTVQSSLYSKSYIGAWHFDKVVMDDRISYVTGKIFNGGEPIIYEKSSDGKLRLTEIDKEYMYGIAKIYKSHKFNVEYDVTKLKEQDLYFDTNKNKEFDNFIREAARVLKPAYTEINEIKPFGIDILEAGSSSMGLLNNRKESNLIMITPNSNANTYYEKTDKSKFLGLTSLNGFSQVIDWIVAKQIDSTLFKSGSLKVNGKIKSETIKFVTPFKDSNYFVFFSTPSNQKLFWNELYLDRFLVSSSHFLKTEVSWFAFHKDIFGGVYTPNSIYVGKREITDRTFIDSNYNTYTEWPGDINTEITWPIPPTSNLGLWYNNQYIIQPKIGVESETGNMSIDPDDPGYSVLLSSNQNINLYWDTKEINKFTIKTSSPTNCTVHYLVIKNGIEWWDELI